VLACVVTAVVWAAVWRLSGGRWVRVETPSMGTAAPVGTLLWVEPVSFASLRPGDFITFHPPGQPGVTYSHRVYRLDPDGTLRTKGQISAPDPWTLTAHDVVGKVTMRWWGIGWVVEALPVLLIGAVVLAAAMWWPLRGRWRLPVAVVGTALILCLAIVIYQPFTGAQRLSAQPVEGGVRATYVSTGLLPLRLHSASGQHVDLRNGQTGALLSTKATSPGSYPVHIGPHFPFWWWIVLVLACFVPAVWTVVFAPKAEPAARQPSYPRQRTGVH